MRLSAIIIDDDPKSIVVLQSKLKARHPSIQVVATCTALSAAMFEIVKHKPDLLFLDINMESDTNGLQFFQYIKDLHITLQCIIVSAHTEPEYFKEAIRLGLAYYLLKPVMQEELEAAINQVTAGIETGKADQLFNDFTDSIQKLTLPIPNGIVRVAERDILYAKANGKFTDIVCTNSNTEHIPIGLSEFEKLLTHHELHRLDRFIMVNKNHIERILFNRNKISFSVNGQSMEVVVSKAGIETLSKIMKT